MGLEVELDAFSLEERQELLHRPPELRLAPCRLLGPAVELRVHRGAADRDRELDCALPVADRGLALVLVRTRPAIERQDRGELHPGVPEGNAELLDLRPIRAGMEEERDEVRPWGQLDRVVADVGRDPADLGERPIAEHVWIEGDLHRRVPPWRAARIRSRRSTPLAAMRPASRARMAASVTVAIVSIQRAVPSMIARIAVASSSTKSGRSSTST